MISYRLPIPIIILALLMVFPVGLHSQTPHPEPVGLRPDAPIYAKHGPYWVGTREFVIKTDQGGRSLPATLLYPALNPKGAKEANTVTSDARPVGGSLVTFGGHALQDAAPDPAGGPYPLVVISHGDPGTRQDSLAYMEHWASHGFMVLAADHGPKNMYRHSDVEAVIDLAKTLQKEGTFAKLIDVDRIAVAGYSFGGLVALQMGGACFRGLEAPPRNSSLQALLLMAPGADTLKSAEALDLSGATLPVLVLVGDQDARVRFPVVEAIYQALPPANKRRVAFKGGTHDTFFDPLFNTLFPGELNWNGLDLARTQDLINHFSTAFLLDVLKVDAGAHKTLLPEAVKFAEVQYATTGK